MVLGFTKALKKALGDSSGKPEGSEFDELVLAEVSAARRHAGCDRAAAQPAEATARCLIHGAG